MHIALEINDRRAEGSALSDLGSALIQLKKPKESLKNLNRALTIFREIKALAKEAESLKNLAELHQSLGEYEVAKHYYQQALELATKLGIPLATECEVLLQNLRMRTNIENL